MFSFGERHLTWRDSCQSGSIGLGGGASISLDQSMAVNDETEANPLTARTNAQRNFERLRVGLPAELIALEDGFARELEALPGSPSKRLRALYAAMTKISDGVSSFAACKSGCSGCCHYNVSVFPIEARYIEQWAGKKRLPQSLPPEDFHGTPCAFLEEGRCSIYEHRPMACRKHFAITDTAYWCAPERCNDEEFPIVNFSAACEAFEAIVRSDGRGQPLDMRQWFGRSRVKSGS